MPASSAGMATGSRPGLRSCSHPQRSTALGERRRVTRLDEEPSDVSRSFGHETCSIDSNSGSNYHRVSTEGCVVRRLLVFALVLFLFGCSTSPAANPVAISPLAYQSPPDGDHATITAVRDSGYLGSFCSTIFYIDGQTVAVLEASQMVTVFVPAGTHIFGVGPKNGGMGCFGEESRRREIGVELKPGDVKKYRLTITEGVYSINPTAF
jgi:hypothetical protein